MVAAIPRFGVAKQAALYFCLCLFRYPTVGFRFTHLTIRYGVMYGCEGIRSGSGAAW